MEIIRDQSIKSYVQNNPVTSIFVAIITVVQIATYVYGNGPADFETARKFGALLSSNKDLSEWPYLLTSIYQHIGGMSHYFFNITALIIYGPFLERLFGAVRFTILFNVSGIFGSATTLYLTENVISSGASGAIYGLIGVYVALFVKQHPWLDGEVKQRVVPILIYSVIFTFVVPNISITGHLGGLVAGMVLGMVVSPKPYPPRNRLTIEYVGKAISLTIAFFVLLHVPKWATAESNFMSFDSSLITNINVKPISFLTNRQDTIYEDLTFLSSLYNEKAMVYYTDLTALTSTMETNNFQLQQLKDIQEGIQYQITHIEAKKTTAQTAIVTQNLKEIFIDLHDLTQLIISQKEMGTYYLNEKIQQEIYQVYNKTMVFTENMNVLYQHLQ